MELRGRGVDLVKPDLDLILSKLSRRKRCGWLQLRHAWHESPCFQVLWKGAASIYAETAINTTTTWNIIWLRMQGKRCTNFQGEEGNCLNTKVGRSVTWGMNGRKSKKRKHDHGTRWNTEMP